MFEHQSGNILAEDSEALVNTVNCVGVMGRGVALQFKKAFPENFKAYARACKEKKVTPGEMFVFETRQLVNPRLIINFPTKHHWRAHSRLEDIENGLRAFKCTIQEYEIRSIALPDAVALEAEKPYGWQFTIYCPSKVVEGITVEGDFTEASLKQVTLGNSPSESNLTALEKVQIYVDEGIWNDVLTMIMMAPLREQEPETWQALLDYLNLGEFADTEVVLIEPQ